ncbi:hypothetical protein CHUAL_000995 [Chamberlinius hualienensis]
MNYFITIVIFSLALAVVFVLWSIYTAFTRKSSIITNKHVLITGGSSGIGKCCAIEAIKRGANVTIVARHQAKLKEAKDEIEAYVKKGSGQVVNIVSLDISKDYGDVEKTIKQVEEMLGPIYVLINCAGFAVASRIEDTSVEVMRNLLEVNLIGSFYFAKAVIASMKQQKEGHIAFTSSQAGLLGVYGYSAYSAAKFALRGLAETLQMEVKPYNIRITLAFPPDTDTPGFMEEEKTKPEETKIISDTSGLVAPETVAKTMVDDILLGKFFSSVGFDGKLLTTACAGASPATSVAELTAQVFTMGILRLVVALLLQRFDKIIRCCHNKRNVEKDK